VVGQITANQQLAVQLVANAPAQHQQLLTSLAASGPGFGWVVQSVTDGTAIAAFRATQSAADWLHNLDFILAPYQLVPSSGTVHAGFQLYYLTIRNSLLALLSGLPQTCTRLILTGHSLGAGLSELAAPDVLTISTVVGSPRFRILLDRVSVKPISSMCSTPRSMSAFALPISGTWFQTFLHPSFLNMSESR
jgi:hypothetical protein